MKKIPMLILIFINISYICLAQPGDRRDKAEAIQASYITTELKLSPEEAQKFWPIYRNYKEEIRRVRLENRDDEILFEERVLGIRKKYKPAFKSVLVDAQRVNRVYVVDKNFREMLRKELQNRRKNKQPARQEGRKS
jgi:hypothetical protein